MADEKSLAVVEPKALEIVPVKGVTGLEPMGTYEGTAGTYEVFTLDGGPLVATDGYALYVAKLPSGQMGLMKIAQNPEENDALDLEARVLATLKQIAAGLDEEAKTAGERTPNYGADFPDLIETLIPEDVGKQVLFLGFHPSIATYQQLIPVSVATSTQRVDLQTGAWMIAKGAKMLGFVHSLGFGVGFLDASNILLETAQHGIFALDFSRAIEDATEEACRQEVRDYARLVWNACGGTNETDPPHDTTVMSAEHYADFVAFLKDLMEGNWQADDIVPALYAKADVYWPKVPIEGDPKLGLKRQFHPWATLPR